MFYEQILAAAECGAVTVTRNERGNLQIIRKVDGYKVYLIMADGTVYDRHPIEPNRGEMPAPLLERLIALSHTTQHYPTQQRRHAAPRERTRP